METKINSTQTQENIWTQDNLVAGDDLAIQLLPQPLIDSHTTLLSHFDDNMTDVINGKTFFDNEQSSLSGTVTYLNGKFDKGAVLVATDKQNYNHYSTFSSNFLTANTSFTIDFWAKCQQAVTDTYWVDFYLGNKTSPYYDSLSFIIKESYFVLDYRYFGTGNNTMDYPSGYNPQNWNHYAFVFDKDNSKTYFFVNGKTVFIGTFSGNNSAQYGFKGVSVGNSSSSVYPIIDELRESNIARWTSDFTPYEQPYTYGGSDVYRIQPTNLINTTALNTALSTKQDLSTAWNQTNLTAGTNIDIAVVPSPVVDSHTLLLSHFDTQATAFKNVINGNSFSMSYASFNSSWHKFGTGGIDAPYQNGTYDCFTLPKTFQSTDDFTIDFWFAKAFSSGKDESCCFKYDVGSGSNLYRGFTFVIQNNQVKATLNKVNSGDPDKVFDCINGWNHIAYERVGSTGMLNMYLNGKLVHSQLYTNSFNSCWWNSNNYRGHVDELRVSDIARYNGQDFTPFQQPYSSDNPALYKINSTLTAGTGIDITGNVISATGGSGSAPTTVWFKNNTGTTLNTELALSDTTEVYKNGILLEPSVLDSDLESDEEINDYTISGSSIIFTDALVSTDKITVKVY